MLNLLIKKCITGIAASFIFTSVTALIFMNAHYGFSFYIIVIGIYALMFMVFIGVPVSLVIEYVQYRISNWKAAYRFIVTAGLYGLLGLFLSMLLFSDETFGSAEETSPLLWVLGVGAALVFMLVDLVVKKLLK